MKSFSTIFFSLVLPLTLTASPQSEVAVSSGTILLFYKDNDKAIVAADSRISFGKPVEPPDNSGCKVIALSDDTLFFYSGGLMELKNLRTNEVLLSANKLARKAFALSRGRPHSRQQVFDLALRWAAMTKNATDRILPTIPKIDEPHEVQLGGFVGLDADGGPVIFLANIGITIYDTGGAVASYGIDEWPRDLAHPIGEGGTKSAHLTEEFIGGHTDRAKRALAEFKKRYPDTTARDYRSHWLTAAVESALKWAPRTDFRVGGKVDSVTLERNGKVRWIQRKQSCYAEDGN